MRPFKYDIGTKVVCITDQLMGRGLFYPKTGKTYTVDYKYISISKYCEYLTFVGDGYRAYRADLFLPAAPLEWIMRLI